MATQNLKRKKINNHLADRKRTRPSKDPAIITPLSDKQTSNRPEEALRQSEERYRTLVEESFDGIFVQKGLKIIFANRRFYEILGYVNGELEGLDHWLVYHPDYRELTRERAKARMRGENVTPQYEVKLQRKDGSSFDGEINARRIMLGNEPGIQVWVKDITERKNAEEALRESEERYRSILENIADGYYEADIAGNLTFFNDFACRMLGYSKDELMGMNNRQYMDQENAKKLYQVSNKVFRTGEPAKGFDWEIIGKDGTKRFIEASISLIKYSSGQPIGYRGVVRDITERKRAEEVLRQSEEKYRTILENIEDGHYEVDLPGNLTFFNDSLCRLVGYSKEELMGMNNRQLTDPENAQKLYQEFNKVYRTGGSSKVFNWEIIKKDGTKRNVEASVSLIKDSRGHSIGFRGIVRDITERKQAEENLKESEEKYRLLVEESLQGIVISQGNPPCLVFANPAMTMILGYTYEELSSLSPKGIEGLVHPEDRAFFFKNYKDRLEGKSVLPRYEIRGIRKDGSFVWLELSSARIEYKGEPAVQAAFLDITERKQAEEALRKSEERYRTILENIEDGYYEVDIAGNVTFCNDSFGRMLGYPKDELMGMNNRQYMDQENAQKLYQAFNKVYRTREPTKTFDLAVIRKDGTKLFGEVSVSLMRDAKGQPIGFRGIARDITQRKNIEEALRLSEKKYRELYQNLRDGSAVVNMKGKIIEFNEAFQEILGYEKEEIYNLTYEDITPKKWHPIEAQVLRDQVFKKGYSDIYEKEYRKKDGTIFPVNLRTYLVKDENGTPIGMWAFVRDISEQKQAEESLRSERQRLESLAENSPFGMVMIDQGGTFKYMNPKFRELFGYDLTDIPDGKTWFRKAYPNPTYRHDVIGVWINDLKSSKPGEKRSQIFTVTCKDGTEKTINFIPVQLVTGENLMACEDITERMMAGEALKKSEVRFQELFNDAPVGYFEYDVEGCIIDANRTELGMLGYTLEEMIGQPVWKFIVEEEVARQQILEKLGGTMPPGRGVERTYRRKDGTTLPVLIEDRILRDSGGRIIGIRTTIQDISELKQAEEEMRALEEQFRQSQKMEAVGRLGGGIAHDFNNLLTIIKGYSQLSLLDLKENDPLWGNIQEIQKATQRATDLTRQLLAFSRRQILDLKVLDLNTLLKDLDKMLRRIIGEDIELTTLLAENLGRVKIDPGQFEQMILNLAVNARDAIPTGGKLTIETANVVLDEEYARTHVSVTPGPYVRLSVSDTGVGIPLEVKEKVFEPFFTTKEKGKGTGLGLSTVYGIVKQSGGNIWVYSEPAHGTTFKIYLPRVEEDLDTLHGRDETNFLPRGSETVLLVEDEASVRDLAHRLLNQQGYKVLEAANGEEALRVVQEHIGEEIHLLLTDVVMPQMGGKELANQLKLLRPDVKVLYTSGYTDDAIVHHGVLEPGTHFLQKPFSPKTLSHKVREVLDREEA